MSVHAVPDVRDCHEHANAGEHLTRVKPDVFLQLHESLGVFAVTLGWVDDAAACGALRLGGECPDPEEARGGGEDHNGNEATQAEILSGALVRCNPR